MKHLHFLSLILLLAPGLVWAQVPYVTERYQIATTNDVSFGTAEGFDGATVPLSLNVTQPVDDGSGLRPMVLWVHGGGFFDGNRGQMQPLLDRWARRGYVAVSPSYRLGFYGGLIGPPFAYDEAELIRACVRAVQDSWGAVRYMVKHAATYRIDTSRIVLGGISAGALTVMHMAAVDATDNLPPQIADIADAVRYGTAYKRPDLGPITGTLHTDVPTPSVRAVVNVMGGLLSLDYLAGSPLPPIYSYHQTDDPIVPCATARAYHGAPLNISATNPVVHGSCAITEDFERRGWTPLQYKSWIWQGADHDIHDGDAVDLDAAQFVAGALTRTVSVAEAGAEAGDADRWVFPADVYTIYGERVATVTRADDISVLPDGVYAVSSDRPTGGSTGGTTMLWMKSGVNVYIQP